MRNRIGDSLIQAGLIGEHDLQRALDEHRRTGERLGTVLVRMNLATERQIANLLAAQLGFPYIQLSDHPPDPNAVTLISKEAAVAEGCIGLRLENGVLTVAMTDPLRFDVIRDLESQTGCRIRPLIATRTEILHMIQSCYPEPTSEAKAEAETSAEEGRVDAAAHETPVAGGLVGADAQIGELVDLIVKSAIARKASDVHVEPSEQRMLVRYRLDGVLKDMMELPKGVQADLIARIKMMAGMDAGEARLPQDGRLRGVASDDSKVDFRVLTLSTLYGEKIVLRRLGRRRGALPLEDLGMSAASLAEMHRLLRHPRGMVLVTGPTGSGTTTTLVSALKSMQSDTTDIVTIEDPIEYEMPGVSQTEVNAKIGLTFPAALGSILQRDPDVVLVGDIGDRETAALAIGAAQKGMLVLSGLHASDAPSAVMRLIDMGVEPFTLGGGLLGVVGQRLVRRLCANCRRHYTPTADTLRALALSEADASLGLYAAAGCDQCNHTGYRGRIGIFEVLRVTDRIRRLIASRAPEEQLREGAIAAGMTTLAEDGLAKMKNGVTTAEELLRVVTDVREMRTLCSACGAAVSDDFVACPHCGTRLGSTCPHCQRALQPGWNFCPYCARSASEPTRAPAVGTRQPGGS